MATIGWNCISEASWLAKLPLVLLFFNPFLWFAILTLKVAIVIFEMTRKFWPHRYDFQILECTVLPEWLVRKVSRAEAEAENSSYPDRRIIDGIPFGFSNDLWQAILDFMCPEDELWYYDSGNSSSHRYGYVVIRDGKLIANLETSPIEFTTT